MGTSSQNCARRRVNPKRKLTQSYGLHVAHLAGIPRGVIERAREILSNLEKQELDEEGRPVLAKRPSRSRDRNQHLLFEEDRERETPEEGKPKR